LGSNKRDNVATLQSKFRLFTLDSLSVVRPKAIHDLIPIRKWSLLAGATDSRIAHIELGLAPINLFEW
jgi:hypothetical protein